MHHTRGSSPLRVQQILHNPIVSATYSGTNLLNDITIQFDSKCKLINDYTSESKVNIISRLKFNVKWKEMDNKKIDKKKEREKERKG